MKKINAICVYCGTRWNDDLDVAEGYRYGMSICNDCVQKRNLQNMLDEKTILINPITDYHEFQLYGDLTRRDADRLRGCPCNWCSRKSIARIRRYNTEGDLRDVRIIASCEKHLKKLRGVAVALQ